MRNIALILRYDGSRYHGWQVQKNEISVAQTLEEALSKTCGHRVKTVGCGRTDAGVHAIAMRAHVDIEKPLTPFKLTEALNAQLRPAPIAVLAAEIVPDDWHARFSCTRTPSATGSAASRTSRATTPPTLERPTCCAWRSRWAGCTRHDTCVIHGTRQPRTA